MVHTIAARTTSGESRRDTIAAAAAESRPTSARPTHGAGLLDEGDGEAETTTLTAGETLKENHGKGVLARRRASHREVRQAR